MKHHVFNAVNFLKTTAIGGLLFLLPLAVIGGLLGYVYSAVIVVYEPLKHFLPVSDATGLSVLFFIALTTVVLLCFFSGLAARRAIGRRVTQFIEKQLVMVFPKYAIYKDIVAGNLGGNDMTPSLVPVTVRFDDRIHIGYEAGRTEQGLVIVYLPGAPDPWIGSVVLMEPERVEPLAVDFGGTSAICERLGRDSTELLAKVTRSAAEARPEETPVRE